MKRFAPEAFRRRKARLGVLISGRGSNMLALLRACVAEKLPARIALVIADRPGAAGLGIAQRRGAATALVDYKKFGGDRTAFEAEINDQFRKAKVDVICLAGFMRIFTPAFVEKWPDQILNIHPSLLPSFPGLDTHERALAAGVRLHGATVHLVRPALDDGPILAQVAVPVRSEDDADSLAARVLKQEHRLYAHALSLYLSGVVTTDGERAVVRMTDKPRNRSLIAP